MHICEIGETIRRMREERGLTQAQLSEGLCEECTLSKIENGRQQASYALVSALMQRMGVVCDQYYGLRNFNELKQEELKFKIRAAIAEFDHRVALLLLDELISVITKRTKFDKQFILWVQAINGRLEDGNVVPYSLQERLNMLTKAMEYTMPNFQHSYFTIRLFSVDEMKIAMAIANTHLNMQCDEKATQLYNDMWRYVKENILNITEAIVLVPTLAFNFSTALGIQKRYNEELEVIMWGKNYCLENRQYSMLGELLTNQCCALAELNRLNEARITGKTAYYVLLAMERTKKYKMFREHYFNLFSEYPD